MASSLHAGFDRRRRELLVQREAHRDHLAQGDVGHREETRHIREGEWTVDPIPETLLERRVELLGGTTRRELVRGLNSGAKSYIADLWNFSPSDPDGVLRGLSGIARAAQLDLAYMDSDGDRIRINPRTSTRLMVGLRPLYVMQRTLLIDDQPVAAAFFDIAVLAINCGNDLITNHGGIHLVLRDVQNHLEARLWAQLFGQVEEHLDLPQGTIRVTVVIDSIPAALELEEILFELMHHAAGSTLDPQAYAADHIALFNGEERGVFPDRELIGLNAPFLRSLALHLVGTCHRRGCHALGAPSFVLPPVDPDRMKASYLEMLADKEREAVDGFDGTMVVQADSVNPAMVEFNKSMPRANQLYYQRNDQIVPEDLVRRPEGPITVESLVGMIRTALRSMADNEIGTGWVIQGGRLHDRSSLRLAIRTLWQWNHGSKGVITASGLDIHDDLLKYLVRKEAEKMFPEVDGAKRKRVDLAVEQLLTAVLDRSLPSEPN
jgi:malate synthase